MHRVVGVRGGLRVLVIVAALGLGVGPGLLGRGDDQAVAQDAGAAVPATLTYVNPGAAASLVRLYAVASGGGRVFVRSTLVGAAATATIAVPALATPTDYGLECAACPDTPVALASGQRLLVVVGAQPDARRTEVFLVNERAVRVVGTLRTGWAAGEGRRVASFDLAPEAAQRVGLRLAAGQAVDLHAVCGGCETSLIRVRGGYEIEIPLR